MAKFLTSRAENYSQWYNDLVIKADLADNSAVRGCMVIKPYGYAIWERIQAELDKKFKATGHVNAYFPLFIPKSFFSREAAQAIPAGEIMVTGLTITATKAITAFVWDSTGEAWLSQPRQSPMNQTGLIIQM